MDLAKSQLQSELTDTLCMKWWVAMGDIFGNPWYAQNGPEPVGVWKSSLAELKLERALAVLQHFRVSGDHFPPNLSQVMKVARDIKLRPQEEPKRIAGPRNPEVAASACKKAIEFTRAGEHRFRRKPTEPPVQYNDEYWRRKGVDG